ncbi:hypothetical protein DKE45_012150 [Acinetobacter pittii]|nr:hypothetical protein DKE45_012150 [Acinetobacter pittii]
MSNSKNIICPDDKDIYTTLQSSNINNSIMEELFLNHFTLTSNLGNKEKKSGRVKLEVRHKPPN